MGQTLDCFCKGIESTQSHRLEEAIPDSYDKCETRFTTHHGHERKARLNEISNIQEAWIAYKIGTLCPYSSFAGCMSCWGELPILWNGV